MPSLDELFQGFKMLDQGVTGLALHDAMSKANDQVYQIRNSQAAEEEKIGALRNVATDFTLKLTGMGIEPGKISEATKSIAPPLENLKTPEDMALMAPLFGFKEAGKRAEKMIEQKHQFELQKIREATTLKQQNKISTEMRKDMNDFRDKAAKKDLEELTASRSLQDLTDPAGVNNLTTNLAMLASIKSQLSRVSNQEIKAAIPNPSVYQRVMGAIDRGVYNEPNPADVEAFRNLGNLLSQKATERVKLRANNWAKNRAGNFGLTAPDYSQMLHSENLFDQPGYQSQSVGQAPGAAQPSQAAPTSGLPGFTPYNK